MGGEYSAPFPSFRINVGGNVVGDRWEKASGMRTRGLLAELKNKQKDRARHHNKERLKNIGRGQEVKYDGESEGAQKPEKRALYATLHKLGERTHIANSGHNNGESGCKDFKVCQKEVSAASGVRN